MEKNSVMQLMWQSSFFKVETFLLGLMHEAVWTFQYTKFKLINTADDINVPWQFICICVKGEGQTFLMAVQSACGLLTNPETPAPLTNQSCLFLKPNKCSKSSAPVWQVGGIASFCSSTGLDSILTYIWSPSPCQIFQLKIKFCSPTSLNTDFPKVSPSFGFSVSWVNLKKLKGF